MESILPKSFIEALSGALIILAMFLVVCALFPRIRSCATRLFAIILVAALALFCNKIVTYFAALFIIATAVTELEFLQNLAAIIRGDKSYFDYKAAISGKIEPPQENVKPKRQLMEYKILNTLWTKQVNKFPDFTTLFTFRLHANSSEYLKFREASSKLIGEGLISETDQGQLYLTNSGFDHCKQHYGEFPSDQWWPEETINEENLRGVLNKD